MCYRQSGYLTHAIHKQFSSSLIKLLIAIREGDAEQIRSAAKEAMRVGHSSGMDSVTGLLIRLTGGDIHSPSPLDLLRSHQ